MHGIIQSFINKQALTYTAGTRTALKADILNAFADKAIFINVKSNICNIVTGLDIIFCSIHPIFKNESKYLELLKTYRSSKEIVEYTNKILNLNHVNAIRHDTHKPIIFRRHLENLKDELLSDIKTLSSTYSSVAIITKDDREAKKIYSLIKKEVNVSYIGQDTKNFKRDLIVVPAYLAKGLEFDSVILYNDRKNSYKKNERNLLYVACTRAQHELYIYN